MSEHVRVSDHVAERARDVPQSCSCLWQWDSLRARWVITRPASGCIWHKEGK